MAAKRPAEISSQTRLLDQGEIARGGMGSIRIATDAVLCREVAMKLFEPHPGSSDPQGPRRFVQEARITGQLDHPNVVPVYHMAVDDRGTPMFFTMKLVAGRTFTDMIDERELARPSERELETLLRITLKICDAVSFAHSRGVIHRDLKPDNIMVGTHGQVYVMDWGCARLIPGREHRLGDVLLPEATTEELGLVIGTAGYMPPEQAWGRVDECDERSDVFAIGAILYRLLTRRPPYAGREYMDVVLLAQKGEIEPPQAAVGPGVRIPPELSRITMKALCPARSGRHASVDELKGELEAFLRGGTWLTTRAYPPGAVVIQEGDPGEEAFIIASGRCEVVKVEDGKKTTLRVMGPGTVFGEMAILTDRPRSATVIATEELSVLVATRAALEEQLCFDSWQGALVRALAERFRDLDEQLARGRRRAGDARVIEWVRDFVLAGGDRLGEATFEVPFATVAAAIHEDLGIDPDDVAAVLARNDGDVRHDGPRGVVTVFSAGGAAARERFSP